MEQRPAQKERPSRVTTALVAGAGGIGTLATGLVFWRAWRNRVWRVGSGPAYEPWRQWLQGGGARKLVQAAILAANAHNSQPWRFRVAGDTIALFADLERHLGSFDPFRRELHLSLGCALENLVQAARANALSTSIELAPGRLQLTPPGPPADAAARVRLSPALRADTSLYDAIPHRHTHRGAYRTDRDIPEHLLAEMQALVPPEGSLRLLLFTGGARRALGELIIAATEAIVRDDRMATDHARWFRFDWRGVQQHRDGLTLDANVTSPVRRVAAKMRPPSAAQANRQWVRDTADVHVGTAPLLGIIAVRDLYDRPSTLQAGRLWQRIHLWATAQGLAAQPLNQPVELADRERETQAGDDTALALTRLTGADDWRPTFIFRAGYADRPALPSPRRSVESIVTL